MRNSARLAILFLLSLGPSAHAQSDGSGVSGRIQFPPDSPVTLVSADWSESRATQRGGAAIVDLHTNLTLRNTDQRRIRGMTFLVSSQEVTPGGRASVTKVSLDVGQGDNFPIRIDLRLLRPLARAGGSSVEVSLDGVLFSDLSFYGPNRLDSRRALTAWEMEAQRDRRYFRSVLDAEGAEGLRREALASQKRQDETSRLDVRLSHRTTTDEASREAKLAFLRFPDSPVEPVSGAARIVSDVADEPQIEVVNHSRSAVRSLELGWLLEDVNGHEYLAGAVPAQQTIAPGVQSQIRQQSALRFTRPSGPPVSIASLTAFVSQVEFADGSVWIPSRSALDDPLLRKAMAPSAEEQRLTTIYRKRGLNALIDELKKFQ